MRISRERGKVRMRLEAGEGETLAALITDLTGALRPGALADDDPVTRRLFPAAYADDEDATAFRDLTEDTLRSERAARAAGCLTDLSAAVTSRRHTDVHLDEESVERWIMVLNDLRLALGTRIGVSEDDEGLDVPDSPDAAGWALYSYLTGVQDSLVRAVLD